MSRLAAMVKSICDLAGDEVNNYAYNCISSWWQYVRELLLESHKSLGLLVAIVCKTVATNLRREFNDVCLFILVFIVAEIVNMFLLKGSCDEQEEEERWERISHDEAQWGLLIGKLEDIAILGAILE